MASKRLDVSIPVKNVPGGVNETGNDTMQRIVAHLEDNDRSETGGDDHMNEDWLRDKKARNMDAFGGPGGTGSSAAPI